MVDIRTRAKKELKRIITTRKLDDEKCLRLTAPPIWEGEGDFGIVIDQERRGDHSIHFGGVKILLIDPGIVNNLSDAVLDFKDSPRGSRFTLDIVERGD